MFSYLSNAKERWVNWFFERAHSKHVLVWLALVSFAESIFLPIPTAAFLILILMAGAKRWLFYALFTTCFSVLGGVVGYIIGAFFFDTIGISILNFYDLHKSFESARVSVENSAFLFTFIGALTPIPYKIFALLGGFLKINFVSFLFGSILGQGVQLVLVGYVMHLYGSTITNILLKYFNIVVLILIFTVVVSIIL